MFIPLHNSILSSIFNCFFSVFILFFIDFFLHCLCLLMINDFQHCCSALHFVWMSSLHQWVATIFFWLQHMNCFYFIIYKSCVMLVLWNLNGRACFHLLGKVYSHPYSILFTHFLVLLQMGPFILSPINGFTFLFICCSPILTGNLFLMSTVTICVYLCAILFFFDSYGTVLKGIALLSVSVLFFW